MAAGFTSGHVFPVSPFPRFAFSPVFLKDDDRILINLSSLPPLDGLIVLGARLNPQGQPGRVARLRLLHALKLWRQHYPQCPLLITGGQLPGTSRPEARAMGQWILDWVRDNWGPELAAQLQRRLILEEASLNTAASARHTLQLVRELEMRAVGLVSDSFHMRRACFLFRRHYSRHGLKVHPLPARGLVGQYWRRRRYLWLAKMVLREGAAWVKALGSPAWGRRRHG